MGVAKRSFADKCVPKPGAWERGDITSNGSGCPESVGATGIAVPPTDPQALRAALAPLLADAALRSHYGARARERVLASFDWEVLGGRYLSELERLAEK